MIKFGATQVVSPCEFAWSWREMLSRNQVGDASHINLAELDAVVKGVNLAVDWNVRCLEVMTDSRTVYSWLEMLVTDAKRLKVSSLEETVGNCA